MMTINRKEFYGTCAEIVTNAILARIHEKYGKNEETMEKEEG